jgi:hypothetical protein
MKEILILKLIFFINIIEILVLMKKRNDSIEDYLHESLFRE